MAALGESPVAVFTLPPSKASRHSDYADLAPVAARYRVPIVSVDNINDPEALKRLRECDTEYSFVVGWSQICQREFLDLSQKGAIGFHPSLLPENRGRAVIPWTILQGKRETGATLFWLAEGIDAGDILLQEKFAVAPDETSRTLYQKHLQAMERLLRQAFPLLRSGSAPRVPQDHTKATYCAKRTPADGLIDWTQPADSVWTLIRAVTKPYPGAFTYYKHRKLVVWEAEKAGPAPFWGQPGQIQKVSESGALVQCGDREHVLLKDVELETEGRMPANQVLKLHEKLGFDWVEFYQRAVGS
jgi:methionyl-tRNA formyltransferase